ncbi:MAG TPA: 16S rRNA (adenine(1518)-N(6)/adenine(1519)-N(6))-dimethyltransferase RsmA [Candidatus Saccharimonadales bacterium]
MQSKPKLGQHWLKDQTVLKTMVETAAVNQDSTVLEIGPGQGALTDKLAAAGASVVAVELDPEIANKLAKSFKESERIQIVHGDILRYDVSHLPQGYTVAANIPYYLTAPILKQLVTSDNPPKLMVLLVQAEVAQRLAARPGNLSTLGVAIQFFGNVEIIKAVLPSAFEPQPKVHSAIIAIRRKPDTNTAKVERIMKLVRHGFANKRKTLINSLSAGLKMEKPLVTTRLKQAGLPPNVRAQDLTLESWEKLYNLFEQEKHG